MTPTPEERADQLADRIIEQGEKITQEGGSTRRMKNFVTQVIAAQIREAELKSSEKWHKAGYEDGFRAAKKKAAKIYDDFSLIHPSNFQAGRFFAREIRQMEME